MSDSLPGQSWQRKWFAAPNIPFVIGTPVFSNGNLTLNWTGGIAPFQIEGTADFQTWTLVGKSTLEHSSTFLVTGSFQSYRVQQQFPQPLMAKLSSSGTQLTWDIPTL